MRMRRGKRKSDDCRLREALRGWGTTGERGGQLLDEGWSFTQKRRRGARSLAYIYIYIYMCVRMGLCVCRFTHMLPSTSIGVR